mmetsp:Transcript_124516/g.346651  ORF Transcript_124516/g.346651 Transcript_124516/m.346651 type:complete len:103 (+) Transcript_124516:80-388(+)
MAMHACLRQRRMAMRGLVGALQVPPPRVGASPPGVSDNPQSLAASIIQELAKAVGWRPNAQGVAAAGQSCAPHGASLIVAGTDAGGSPVPEQPPLHGADREP